MFLVWPCAAAACAAPIVSRRSALVILVGMAALLGVPTFYPARYSATTIHQVRPNRIGPARTQTASRLIRGFVDKRCAFVLRGRYNSSSTPLVRFQLRPP